MMYIFAMICSTRRAISAGRYASRLMEIDSFLLFMVVLMASSGNLASSNLYLVRYSDLDYDQDHPDHIPVIVSLILQTFEQDQSPHLDC